MEYVEEWDIGLELKQTHWAIRNYVAQSISDFFGGALTMVDAETLYYLGKNSDKHISVSDVCHKFHVQKGTCSENVHRMEEKGLIKLSANPHDKRTKHITLTEKGKEVSDEVVVIFNKCHETLKSILNDDEHLSLMIVLNKLRKEVIKD